MTLFRSFIIPATIAFLIASFYIVFIPSSIKSDALEYDKLADSVLTGQYSIDGNPSMEREPGYPFFRAIVKLISSNPETIRWIQALLYILIVLIIGLAGHKIDHRLGTWSAWGASLSYGLAFYPSMHLSETFTAFLLSATGLLFLFTIEKPLLKNWALLSSISAVLILTRYTYVLVPIIFILILAFYSHKEKTLFKIITRNVLISLGIIFLFVSPWVIRNYLIFNEINVAGRSGAILYARAWKTDKPWRVIPDSYMSVLLGRGLLFSLYPNNQSVWLEQWGDWWRNKEQAREMWGNTLPQMDKNRKAAALNIIFKDVNNITKFIVWSGIDELRLLELPNPLPQSLGSPIEGTYGPLGKENKLSGPQITALLLAHAVQLVWFVLIAISTYLGFKKYGFRFIPGIFLICILLPHAIADNIARYGAPLQPWLLSGIFMTILFPLYTKLKDRENLTIWPWKKQK